MLTAVLKYYKVASTDASDFIFCFKSLAFCPLASVADLKERRCDSLLADCF